MNQEQQVPGEVGSQDRTPERTMGANAAPVLHYTQLDRNVKLDPFTLATYALDWAASLLRDARRAHALGNCVAEDDLLGCAAMALKLADQYQATEL